MSFLKTLIIVTIFIDLVLSVIFSYIGMPSESLAMLGVALLKLPATVYLK